MSRLLNWRAPALSLIVFLLMIGAWHVLTLPKLSQQTVYPEYAALVGAEAATGQKETQLRQNVVSVQAS